MQRFFAFCFCVLYHLETTTTRTDNIALSKYDSISLQKLPLMVESKVFSTEINNEDGDDDASPPIVQVQAGEPLDLWHLQAVPVVEPSAPLHVYDQGHSSNNFQNEPIPTIVTPEASPFDDPGINMDFEDVDDPERKVAVGAGVASGVLG